MDINKLEDTLCDVFGEKNVKPHAKGFRVIIEYENMPFCIVLRIEDDKIIMERDAVDEDEANYEEAYKLAYKSLIQNKDKFDNDIVI